jgi:Tfp pilus assembly protein PilE
MGQQQLLLVILVTIIVGIATVVAINTFSSAAESANLDAVRQDVAAIAASAQGYYIKPAMLGGGSNSFTGLTFEKLTFAGTVDSTDATKAFNENGSYSIVATASDVAITATPSSGGAALTATVTKDNLAWD